MSALRRIVRGADGHPGNMVLLAMALLGWIAAGHWWGALGMLAIFGPVWVIGAWGRG